MEIKNLELLKNSPSIIFITTHSWDGLQYFAHHFSRFLDCNGFQVFFIEKSPQRWPKKIIPDLFDWLRKRKQLASKTFTNNNIHIITPRWLPPAKWLRILNRFIIKRDVNKINRLRVNGSSPPILIIFPPTYNAIDFIDLIHPKATAYINNFNYEANNVMRDLLKSEIVILSRCNAFYGLTNFCSNRIKSLAPMNTTYTCPPGVNYNLFHQAFRGDESIVCKTAFYFGGIGYHLDLSVYDALADSGIHVVMDGIVDPSIKDRLNTKFEIRPPSTHSQLPTILREADILIIAYKNTEYMKGVFPAKFYECLATGKPLLVSGLPELTPFYDVVYNIDGSGNKAIEVVNRLSETETPERIYKRNLIAQEADWSNRFETFLLQFNEQYMQTRKERSD